MLSAELVSSSEESRFTRISVSAPEDDLAVIDRAAEAVGETRSNYLIKAALMRAGMAPMSLTPADLKAISELMKGTK
jgi:hypothetical protein